MPKYLIILFAFFCATIDLHATTPFVLSRDSVSSSIWYGGGEQVINTAIDILMEDSSEALEIPFRRVESPDECTIVVGIPGKEPNLEAMVSSCGISTADLDGKWEAYKIQQVSRDGRNLLFVLGSDPRGTAYGILELSRCIGVTPWIWWADVLPEKHSYAEILPDGQVHSPSVRYRGIFINDEDWGFMPWSSRTHEPSSVKGEIGPRTYSRIFELLLRLRANTVWPAMHECTVPFFQVEGNQAMAAKYGIVLGTSHAEPMMCTNTGEWNEAEDGPFNFLTNRENVLSYWDNRVAQLANTENIYTVGMRGIHDGRMQGVSTLDEETTVLSDVISEQRKILRSHYLDRDISGIPQIFVPYKEVLDAYENGLELPEDITLVWCDDNHGHIMRLDNSDERKRPGGSGVYYHISYWGKPHDYLWLASTQPALVYVEMKRAWDYGARKLWVLNVGDIKPGEYLTEFFLDMAWDINSVSSDKINEHLLQWLVKVFPGQPAERISYILQRYYLLAGQRKPEHMGWNLVEDPSLWTPENPYGLQPVSDTEFSTVEFGDEIQRRIRAYDEIESMSEEIYDDMPDRLKSAYFQLVHYPVAASAAMNRKILFAQKSRMAAGVGDFPLASCYASLAMDAYDRIAALDYAYNKDISGGKWELMMDMKPRDLPVFQEPVLPELPAVSDNDVQIHIPEPEELAATAGTPYEGDRMVALNACDYTNDAAFECVEGLGHSGMAVRLSAAKKINVRQPHLEYEIYTESCGMAKVKIGTVPFHPADGRSSMRYALVIDDRNPVIVDTSAPFLSDKWTSNVLRNQSLTVTDVAFDCPGKHVIRVYAIDEDIYFDQLMVDFNLERKHYLIPVKF